MKIFNYIPQLDCFVVDPAYNAIAERLGISEWNEVVWIGRYFSLDNDNGEHWFDNWEGRDRLEAQAKGLGIAYDDLLIIDPEKFKNNHDGPCHTASERKSFWTDVLISLDLSIDTIINEAVKFNRQREKQDNDFINDLADRIKEIKDAYL